MKQEDFNKVFVLARSAVASSPTDKNILDSLNQLKKVCNDNQLSRLKTLITEVPKRRKSQKISTRTIFPETGIWKPALRHNYVVIADNLEGEQIRIATFYNDKLTLAQQKKHAVLASASVDMLSCLIAVEKGITCGNLLYGTVLHESIKNAINKATGK